MKSLCDLLKKVCLGGLEGEESSASCILWGQLSASSSRPWRIRRRQALGRMSLLELQALAQLCQ